MPRQARYPTKYPGVYFILGKSHYDGKPEKIFYIRYRHDGRQIDEKAGRSSPPDLMTAARAAQIRVERIKGGGSNRAVREKKAWMLESLWNEYAAQRPNQKSHVVDAGRFFLHIKPRLGEKSLGDLRTLDIDKLRAELERNGKSPQTVKHVLALIKRLINFGVKKGLIDQPDPRKLRIELPKVDNEITEDLTHDQLRSLLKALDEEPDQVVADVLRFALVTGMRRGEIFRLQWGDLNFERETIFLRDPKGGKSEYIPMNAAAREILSRQGKKGLFVFCYQDGRPLGPGIYHKLRKIKAAANLPDNFRMLHGLRHVFASTLASSGQVDLYTLQKLLTHKSSKMTARYSHLRDEALKRSSEIAGAMLMGKEA